MDPTLVFKIKFFSFFLFFLFFYSFFHFFFVKDGKTALDVARDQSIVELIIQLKVSFFSLLFLLNNNLIECGIMNVLIFFFLWL